MTVCKNCAQEFDGKYCPNCGQKGSTRRIVTRDLFSDLLDKVLPWDKGILFTTRRLLGTPGKMVREYLDGRRVGYTKPLSYLLLVVAAGLLFFSQEDFMNGLQQSGAVSPESALSQKIGQWVFSNMSAIFLGLIPFLALFSKGFFRRSGENYAEHLVLNVYLMAGSSLVSMPFMILAQLWPNAAERAWFIYGSLPFYLTYFVWGYLQFFQPRRRFLGGVKAVLVYTLGYLLFLVFTTLLIFVAVKVYFGLFPAG